MHLVVRSSGYGVELVPGLTRQLIWKQEAVPVVGYAEMLMSAVVCSIRFHVGDQNSVC